MKKLLFLLILFSCQVKEPASEIFSYATPESQGVSSQAILDFVDTAERLQPDALHSIMIVRHGHVIAEGWWKPYNADSPHLLYSLSKSFTSTAIGLAIAEGLITIDDPVISFFPDKSPENPSENLKNMRLRDLITMNSGHEQDASQRMRSHPDGWVAGFLSLEVEHKPGTIFVYNSGATYMLSAIIQKVTGQTLTEYLQTRLFDPLEIEKPTWESDPDGINVGGWGLSLKTRDIAKLGQLYLQKGKWNGNQILSEKWVETATSLQTSNGSNPYSDWDQGYGYQFWRCRHNMYRGDGAFGQYCIVMPEQDAVVAITSGSNDMQGIMNMIWDHLLPAMQDEALADNVELQVSLKNRLENLALSTVSGEATSPKAIEISGSKYILDQNIHGIDAIEFNLDKDPKKMQIWTNGEQQEINIGYSEMTKGSFSFLNQGEKSITTSGAWKANDHFRTRIYLYETPHAITFDFQFEGDVLTWDAEYNVTFGPSKLPQVLGKLEQKKE